MKFVLVEWIHVFSNMNVLYLRVGGKTTRTVTARERQEISSRSRTQHVKRESTYSRKNRRKGCSSSFCLVKSAHLTWKTCLQLKKDLQDVAQAEADIANLEYKVDDLENRLGQQEEVKTSGSTHGASKESRKIPEHNAKM